MSVEKLVVQYKRVKKDKRSIVFQQILTQFEPMMYDFVWKLSAGNLTKSNKIYLSTEDKQDLLSELKMATLRSIKSFSTKKKCKFITLLYTSMRNATLSFATNVTKERVNTTSIEDLSFTAKESLRDERDLLGDVEKNMLRKKILDCIRDKKTRLTISGFLDEKSISTISKELRCSNVRSYKRIKALKSNKKIRQLFQEVVYNN